MRSLVIAIALCLGLAACGGKSKSGEEQAIEQVREFIRAADANDGKGVCATLMRASVRELERLAAAQGRREAGCAGAVIAQLRSSGLRRPRGKRKLGTLTARRPNDDLIIVDVAELAQVGGAGVELNAERGTYRIDVRDVLAVGHELEVSIDCSAARQALLRIAFPPVDLREWPSYLRRVADRVAQIAERLPSITAAGLQVSARALRGLARPIPSGTAGLRMLGRIVERLQVVDDAAGLLLHFEPDLDGNCGPDPRETREAKAFRSRVDKACGVLDKRSDAIDAARDRRALLRAVGASIGAATAFIETAERAPLPAVLEPLRDGLPPFIRALLRFQRERSVAVRENDPDAFVRRLRPTTLLVEISRFILAAHRLHLKTCFQFG